MIVEKIYFRKYCLNYVIEYKVEKHTQISTLFEQGNLHIITIDKISSEVRKCVYFSPKQLRCRWVKWVYYTLYRNVECTFSPT